MTGFGKGETRAAGGVITAEFKTVNHKYFEITCKLPNSISMLEDRIKQLIQRKIRRGKVNLSLACEGTLSRQEKVMVNVPMARSYLRELTKLKKALDLKGDITVDDLILFPGILNYEAHEADLMKLWPKIAGALENALDRLIDDRTKEGRALGRDLLSRVRKIETMLATIAQRAEANLHEYKIKFAERIRTLTGSHEIDPGRLEMEAAIYAKSCDISEEITRLKNHLYNFRKTTAGNGEMGKKLDFIAQELHREVNTIGAKASDFSISKNVINMKSEIEKIREQVKNIE